MNIWTFLISFINDLTCNLQRDLFDTEPLSHGNKGLDPFIATIEEKQDIQKIMSSLVERFAFTSFRYPWPSKNPQMIEVDFGHWKADIVAGKTGGTCLVTFDRQKIMLPL